MKDLNEEQQAIVKSHIDKSVKQLHQKFSKAGLGHLVVESVQVGHGLVLRCCALGELPTFVDDGHGNFSLSCRLC
jgi:hypothetical protein